MLSVRDVTTAYQGLVAISKVSLEVEKGEIVCVAGANGAGKSTLLKSIAGADCGHHRARDNRADASNNSQNRPP